MKNFNNRLLLIITGILLFSNITLLSYIAFFKNDNSNNTFEKKAFINKKPHLERMLIKELNLNENQINEIKERRIVFRKEKIAMHEQMHSIRVQINNEIINEHPDTTKIDSLIHVFAQTHILFDKLNTGSLLEIKQHLTPEQTLKFDSIINNFGVHKPPHYKQKRNQKQANSINN